MNALPSNAHAHPDQALISAWDERRAKLAFIYSHDATPDADAPIADIDAASDRAESLKDRIQSATPTTADGVIVQLLSLFDLLDQQREFDTIHMRDGFDAYYIHRHELDGRANVLCGIVANLRQIAGRFRARPADAEWDRLKVAFEAKNAEFAAAGKALSAAQEQHFADRDDPALRAAADAAEAEEQRHMHEHDACLMTLLRFPAPTATALAEKMKIADEWMLLGDKEVASVLIADAERLSR